MNPNQDAPSILDSIQRTPRLADLYAPIAAAMEQLNNYLVEEFASTEPFVHELLRYIAQYRGKQLRPACVFLSARAVGGEVTADHVKVAAVVELIHTATLVHDDLLDDAKIRRRVETVNQRWGERAAILLGDFIYSRGFTISTEVPGVSGLLASTTHTICEGELLQVGSAFDTQLSQERYNEIIGKKTAILYGMACRLGAMLSGASEEEQQILDDFGYSIGMAFQIADDALDLDGDEMVVGKSLGTDLIKGKMTLPLILLRKILTGGKLEEYLWLLSTPNAQGAQVRVLRMLRESDVLKTVRRRANEYVREGVALLDKLPDNPVRGSFETLAEFITEREL